MKKQKNDKNMLVKENFTKARDYIFEQGSTIDKAWYEYNFKHGSTEIFMNELSKYQFDNGGFGGLVYEYEYLGPCLKCTEHAFRYIYFLKEKPKANHLVIIKMMDYILERYIKELGCWGELLEPEVNDGLHVWWWEYKGNDVGYDNADDRIKFYEPNGQAALAAFVAMYSEIVPKDLYEDIIKYPIEKILRYYDKHNLLKTQFSSNDTFNDEIKNPYNMKCLSQFCDCLQDNEMSKKLKDILCQKPTACMELDQSIWHQGYHETPSDIVTIPNFLYEITKNEVDISLDALISRQSEDGVWHLTYSFGEEKGFRGLERKFEVHYTMLVLAQLKRFDRI